MNKVYPSAAAALEGVVADGQLIAVGVASSPFDPTAWLAERQATVR